MPDFDTSNVAATVGQGQQNPLAGLGQIAQTVGALNQLKLFPLQQQTLQTELQTRQQSLAAAKYGALQTVLAQTGGDDEVPGALNRAVAMGLIDPQTAASAMGGNIPNLSLDAIHRMREQAISGAGNAAELAADRGTASTLNTGGAINTVNTKVAPGGATTVTPAGGPDASLATTLTPSEKVARIPGINPATGVPVTVPQATLSTDTGQPREVPGITSAGGVIQTALAPGAAEARTEVGRQSGAQYAADLAGQGDTQNNIAQLKQVDQLLQAPEGQTGPGTQAFNKWRDAAIAFLGKNAELVPGLDANSLHAATQDELRKYMTRLASVNGSPFGAGTDYRLAQAATGNANPDMSNLANQDVERINLALERAKQARLVAFQQTGLNPEQYSKWAANWSRQVDPRAFMLDLLSPKERGAMLAPIKNKSDIAAMTRGVKAAEAANLFGRSDIPGLGQ